MNEFMVYFDDVQFRAFRARICRYLRSHPESRRRRSRGGLTMSESIRLALLWFRHDLTQRFLAGMFRVHQTTAGRIIAWMRTVFRVALADVIARAADLESALAGLLAGHSRPAVVLVDGTLVPVSRRLDNRDDYSGKHRRAGKNVQVVSDVQGNLLHVGPALPGRWHDAHAVEESGILAGLLSNERLLPHGDKGYIGKGLITPVREYKSKPLTLDQRADNIEISRIRCAVERGIAHLKVLAVLKNGIRTRSRDRERVIIETIEVAVGLAFFKQQMR